MSILRVFGLASLFAIAALPASATNFQVLHAFCSEADCKDGYRPSALILDKSGNLFGGMLAGGKHGAGGIFELSPGDPDWHEHILHNFCAGKKPYCKDGTSMYSGLSVDTEGNFYGSTEDGGNRKRKGVVFKLTRNEDDSYTFQRLYAFCKQFHCADGAIGDGHLVIDTAGNVYGTTNVGGHGHGIAYELSPPPSGSGDWAEKVLYVFCSEAHCADGSNPLNGLTYAGEAKGLPYDGVSPLYGTTTHRYSEAVIYRLAPNGDSTWTETVLHKFCRVAGCVDGESPADYGPLIVDARLNVYGTTAEGGAHDGGTLYRLSPHGNKWLLKTLYDFCSQANCADGKQPYANAVMDASGRLYGTTVQDGANGTGTIYQLTRGASPQMNALYSFCSFGCADGNNPEGSVIVDGAGHIFGANSEGGTGIQPEGTVYELVP